MHKTQLNNGPEMTHTEYRQALARRRRMQWLSIPAYIISVVVVLLIAIYGPVNEETFWPVILIVIYGGQILMVFAIFIYPLLSPIQAPSLPERQLVPPPSKVEKPEGFGEVNHIWILYKISAVMWLVLFTPFVYSAITRSRIDTSTLISLGVAAVLHTSLTWLLGRISAEVNQDWIRAGMGPFKSKTAIGDIESIRSVTVRPLREFMGWGWRVRGDGTRGFIADMNVGVEYVRKSGRKFVVTVQDPQRYVDYVRWVKANEAGQSKA